MNRSLASISLLSLAHYMVARVDVRAAIVANARRKNPAAAHRYTRAKEEVLRILRGDRGLIDVGLLDAATDFRRRTPKGDWDASDLGLSADAFDQLRDSYTKIDLGSRPPSRRRKWPKLVLEGVAISVTPDLILREEGRVRKVGALKLRFGSTRAMEEEEGTYAAMILRYYLLTQLKDKSQRIAPKLCQVVDSATGEVFHSPTAYKRQMGKVRLACAEFRAQWLTAEIGDSEQPEDRPRPGH